MAEMTAEQALEWGKTLSFESTWATITKLGERMDGMQARVDETWAAFKKTDERMQARIDETLAASKAADERTQARIDEVLAASKKADESIEHAARTVDKMAVKVDRTTENVNKMSARIDKLGAKVDRTTEAVKRTTENVNKMSERVDRVLENVGGLNRSVGDLIEILIASRLWKKFSGFHYHLQRAYRRVAIYNERNEIKTDIDILLSDTEWCMAVEVKREADNKDVDKHLQRMELIRKYPPAEVNGKKMLGAIAGGVVPPETRDYAHAAGLFVLELSGESVALLDAPKDFTAREW